MIKTKEDIKRRISRVKAEMKNEANPKKKQRLNKYKQRLEIELRDFTFFQNGGRYETNKN